MTLSTVYPHIKTDAQGTASIGDTRYKVIQIAAEHYRLGWSAEELLRQHPDLQPGEIYAALTYFYDHYEQIVNELHRTVETMEAARSTSAFSRDELLRRLASREA